MSRTLRPRTLPASDPTADQLLKLTDVADRLGVDHKTIRRAVNRGDLAAVRLGTSPKAPIFIRSSALAGYIRPVEPGTISE